MHELERRMRLTRPRSRSSVSGTPSMTESPRQMTPTQRMQAAQRPAPCIRWGRGTLLFLQLLLLAPPSARTITVEDEALDLVDEVQLVWVAGTAG